MFKNGQTYFKNLAVKFQNYVWKWSTILGAMQKTSFDDMKTVVE